MVGCGLACPGGSGSRAGGGGSWGTHTIWGGGVATRNTGPYICKIQDKTTTKMKIRIVVKMNIHKKIRRYGTR